MSEDDEDGDWFEKALEEGEREAEATDGDTVTDEAAGEGATDDSTDDGPFGSDGDDGAFGDPSAESETPFGDDGDGADGPFGGESDDAGGPFGDDGDAGGPFDDDPFGGGDGESLFDEDFGSAFDSGGDDEFDDEELDSDIPRIDLGIEGLDDMIQGGVPERHLIVTIGSAGTGKTTFGLQFLYHGLQQGENAVFITLEQSHESIVDTANEWGWGFDEYEAEGSLAVVDLDPVEMANSLDNIRGELPELIKDFNADRLVLDSVSLLEMMYDNPAKRRTEVFDFTRSLKNAGVTTFLTSEASESNPYASRHGIIEYLTDAVFVLQYIRGETRETRLAVEIQKIRNANHSREMKPYDITSEGLSVYQQANIF
ncbi:MAG: KaiC domain-containing protein [Haloarculaceae archaeon]